MIDHLVEKCKKLFEEEVKIEDPKKYFDDAVVELRILKKDSGEKAHALLD